MKKRVVITGMGAITPVGNSVTEFWDSIRAGRVGIGPITKFDTSEYKVKIAAEVKDFQAKDHMDFKRISKFSPFNGDFDFLEYLVNKPILNKIDKEMDVL